MWSSVDQKIRIDFCHIWMKVVVLIHTPSFHGYNHFISAPGMPADKLFSQRRFQ